ncbi:hypothetical protein FRC08_014109, partial [Ceratobasidium sp. 394]
KRKLHASSCLDALSQDVEELSEALQKCNAFDVLNALADSLRSTPLPRLKVLGEVFTPLLEADRGAKHCVRCHRVFVEADNSSESCAVKHGALEHRSRGDRRLRCCGKPLSGECLDGEDLVCCRLTHTTNPAVVRYFDQGGAEESEDEANPGYWGTNNNIRTCDELKCGWMKSEPDSE